MLDTIITELNQVKRGIENVLTPMFDCLTFRKELNLNDVKKLITLFPKNSRPDEFQTMAELEHFQTHLKTLDIEEKPTLSVYAKHAFEMQKVLPLCYKAYCLALTAPVTVAKNERSFSKLRLVKNHMRSRISEERLEHCMLMSCEKECLDSLNIDALLAQWNKVNRRIKI